ncbi:MAG: hypothetical protein LBP83_04600, partial [Dysgonamonadaceae bacterium]|nr:hypothetical protein [Dysgonamonadaceae bacterium]
MKKIICIFVTICVVIFIACDNKNEVMTNEKEPLVNPYDYIGEIHNDGLSEYLRLIRNSEITDIENFTDDFAVTFIAKEI